MEANVSNELKSEILQTMVKNGESFHRTQQSHEANLTEDQIRQYCGELLENNPIKFVYRFAQYLEPKCFAYFTELRGKNKVIDIYLKNLEISANEKRQTVQVKNRRYKKLQDLIEGGIYFNDHNMEDRNPLLYNQMIGMHLTEKEIVSKREESEEGNTLSGFLLRTVDKMRNDFVRSRQKEDEDLFDGEEVESVNGTHLNNKICYREKQRLRVEFTHMMYEKFLRGEDSAFVDYNSIDNTDNDYMKLVDQDAEDKYFDEEIAS